MDHRTNLPAEWHPHLFTQLTWPHAGTDWNPVLDEAIHCFCAIAREVAKREPLLIASQHPEQTKSDLLAHGVGLKGIKIVQCPTNDTWARDHAFITTVDTTTYTVFLNDFQFNGWGLKFAANHDNRINRNLLPTIELAYQSCEDFIFDRFSEDDIYASLHEYRNRLDFVLEGGSIESDGRGTLMVTTSCLLSDNRNNVATKTEIDGRLKKYFNADRVLWLDHSWLAGDDTDGHIDTVARFCSPDTIAYVKCYDTADEHFAELDAMERELEAFRTTDGQPYRLIPLPLPHPCHDDEGDRLPATYANFYIMNGAVLVPTYNQPDNDAEALHQLQKAFPDREIIGIDCRVLIIQHGSLHCSTMQYPALP